MISEPRTIARIVEFFHIPLQHTPETVRDVYQEVSGLCGYDNFIRFQGGIRLESAASETGAVSRLTFMNDRLSFHEENTNISLEALIKRIEATLDVATEKLNIPILIVRNITLRALSAVPRGTHSSQFLTDNLYALEGNDFGVFERPGSIVGMRMHFPPTDPKAGQHQVRVESYLRDPRMLYLEDIGTFKVPLQSRDKEKIRAELGEVEEFLHERLNTFLNQFPR